MKEIYLIPILIFGGLIILCSLFFLILYFIYAYAFGRSRRGADAFDGLDLPAMRPFAEENRKRIEVLMAMSFEDVYISSRLDGTRLHARFYLIDESAPTEIMCHGYRSTPLRDFSGGALLGLESGHNLLLIDQRAHGQSDGKTITYGIREREDLASWAEYISARLPGKDIILVGISMGGATVVAASDIKLPQEVRCIISDCPYSNLKDILISTAMKLGFPRAVYPLIYLSARIYGGIRIEDGDFRLRIKNARLPILIIHGEDDGFVPAYMSRELAEAAPDMVRRITFAGADHGTSFLVDTERYRNEISVFLNENLSKGAKK